MEYDPNRSGFLARVFNPDTKKHTYITAPTNVKRVILSDQIQQEMEYKMDEMEYKMNIACVANKDNDFVNLSNISL